MLKDSLEDAAQQAVEDRRPHLLVTITVPLSPVVMYHGLARRYLMPLGFLMRPLLNGGTLAGPLMQLFRPTGLRELQLVFQRELRGWPPRLPEQPIFYPVLNVGYAEQIARDWNTKSDSRVGYVTEFWIDDDYAANFSTKVVGASHHEELWVPADSLDEFNTHIAAPIRVIRAFFGDGFTGLVPTHGAMRGRSASAQLETLAGQFAYSLQDLHGEVTQNREAVFLHLPYWAATDTEPSQLAAPKADVLRAVERIWSDAFPTLPLPSRAG